MHPSTSSATSSMFYMGYSASPQCFEKVCFIKFPVCLAGVMVSQNTLPSNLSLNTIYDLRDRLPQIHALTILHIAVELMVR
jgi:hypothetical protein